MGYTHYWRMLKVPSQAEVSKVLSQAKVIVSQSATLFGAQLQYADDDNRPPMVTPTIIQFNGVGSKNGHEGFVIHLDRVTAFDFCKTARKPYDFAVGMILLSLKNHVEGFRFTSDGRKHEWEEIVEQYEKMFGQITTFDVQTLYNHTQQL